MPGGRTTQTVNQSRDPWSPAQPALREAIGGAMNAYNTTFQGPGVAGMDPLVTQGQDSMIANAQAGGAGALGRQAMTNFGGVLGNGGLSDMQLGAASGIDGAMDTYNSQTAGLRDALTPYASGQYLNQRNPYFDEALGNAMSSAADAANRQFSAAGRYGSGAHSGTLGRSLGEIATNANVGEYRNQQQNQFNAINALSGLAGQGFNNQMAGQGALAGLGQQGILNTGAIGSSIPGLSQAMNIDANTLMGIGGQRMDYAQSLIDAADNRPWQRVGNLAQIAGGIGGLGGTMQGTQTTESNPGIAGIIGGAMAGLGGLSNLAGGVGRMGGWSNLFRWS